MSARVAPAESTAAAPAGGLGRSRSSTLTGTGTLIRLILRRDRIRFSVWILAILGLVYFSGSAVQTLYGTAADRAVYADTAGSSAAAIAMSGPPVALHTFGGITIFEINATVMIAVALMAIFLVVRHTRGEEESGRTELLRSAVVGRHAGTVAALIAVSGATIVTAGGITAILLGFGLPAAGSVVYGCSVAALGVFFTAVGAAAAQVTEHARGALGLAGAVIAASFVLRAVGDVSDNGVSWVSPMGWMQATRPYADDRWWPLLLLVAGIGLCVWLTFTLTAHRDVGAGLVQPSPGPASASQTLTSPIGLAVRLQRTSIVWWMVGMFLGGIAFGSFSGDIEEMVSGNEQLSQAMTASGIDNIVDSYFAMMVLLLALIGTGFTVGSVLRMRREETRLRVEPLLATALTRSRWLWSNLLVTLAGTVLTVLAGGFGMGLSDGLASDDLSSVGTLTAAALAYLPAVLVVGALTALLFGWAPRAIQVVWAVLGLCLVIAWLGGLIDFPEWLVRLSPFTHVGNVPAEAASVVGLVVMSVVAAIAALLGTIGLRRRDIG